MSHVQSQGFREALWHSIGKLPDIPWIQSEFYVELILGHCIFKNQSYVIKVMEPQMELQSTFEATEF